MEGVNRMSGESTWSTSMVEASVEDRLDAIVVLRVRRRRVREIGAQPCHLGELREIKTDTTG